MDEIDLKILNFLHKNGRMSWSELAGELGLSSPSTADRVRRLEEKGIIKGYQASIEFNRLGYTLTAFILASLSHPKYKTQFAEEISSYHEIEECHHMTGEDDYLLKVRCFDTTHLDQFLNDGLKQITGIIRTRTTIVLSTLKEMPNTIVAKGNGHAH